MFMMVSFKASLLAPSSGFFSCAEPLFFPFLTNLVCDLPAYFSLSFFSMSLIKVPNAFSQLMSPSALGSSLLCFLRRLLGKMFARLWYFNIFYSFLLRRDWGLPSNSCSNFKV